MHRWNHTFCGWAPGTVSWVHLSQVSPEGMVMQPSRAVVSSDGVQGSVSQFPYWPAWLVGFSHTGCWVESSNSSLAIGWRLPSVPSHMDYFLVSLHHGPWLPSAWTEGPCRRAYPRQRPQPFCNLILNMTSLFPYSLSLFFFFGCGPFFTSPYWICYILLLFYVLVFWPSSPTRDWTCMPCNGR